MALGALESTKALVVARSRGIDFGLGRALATNMSWWILWIPVALSVFALARRVPLRPTAPSVTVHLVACLGLSLLHLAVSSVVVWWAALVPPGATHTLAGQFRDLVTAYLFMEVVTYGAIVAGYAVFVSRARIHAVEEEQARLLLRAATAETERARLETSATRARLRALRSELDPHFLFNSLNSVAALARQGDTEGTVRMLARLGALLRCTLDGSRGADVSVREEAALLRLYLDVEEVRLGPRLTTHIHVDAAVARARVPALILQPLVENAVRHGVSEVERTVSVHVTAEAAAGRLRLTVRDTGPGVAPSGPGGEGRGLQNVRDRLGALGGSPGDLVVRPAPGGGTEAVVHLPLLLPDAVEVAG